MGRPALAAAHLLLVLAVALPSLGTVWTPVDSTAIPQARAPARWPIC